METECNEELIEFDEINDDSDPKNLIKSIKTKITFIELDLEDQDWKHSKFSVSLVFHNGTTYSTIYKLGTGHSWLTMNYEGGNPLSSSKLSFESMFSKEKNPKCKRTKTIKARGVSDLLGFKCKIPTKQAVLWSIIAMDYFEGSFESFCDEFGYDNDSIKALDIFNKTQEITSIIKSVFSTREIDTLQEYLRELDNECLIDDLKLEKALG